MVRASGSCAQERRPLAAASVIAHPASGACMPPVALRPRSTTELIDAAVQLLRQHYMEIVTASAIFLIPAYILRLFLPDVRSGQLPGGDQALLFSLGLLITAIFSIVSTAAVVVVISDSYLGREISIIGAVQRVINRFWSVFAAALLQSIFTFIGFILFVIPGFLCLAWFFACTVVVVVKGKTARAALMRSRQLAAGSVGRILGVLFLTAIILVTIEFIALFLVSIAGVFIHAGAALTTLGANLANLLIYPFFTVVITLLYYDLRIRKEGFDLEMMATELAPSGQPVTPSTA